MSSTSSSNMELSSGNNNNNFSSSSCACSQILTAQTDKTVLKTPVSGVNANILADSLGVSPLYRQQDSARWQSAAQVYQSSRAHSPVFGGSGTPNQFSSAPVFECVTPQILHQSYYQQASSAVGSPISLEDIATVNRRRYKEVGDTKTHHTKAGSLELEAIAAVHELACSVKAISVSEILPRTADLIFVNIKTHEDHAYTLELTMKGWRVASTRSDCMNGDYSNVDLHTCYFANARDALEQISPGHAWHFNDCLAERLKQLEKKDLEES